MDNYSEKLQKIIRATGWSQEFLAVQLDTSFVTLNSWINGKSTPRDSAKERIDFITTDVLGVDSVDQGQLSTLKKSTISHKYSAKKLVSEKSLLENLTTSLTYHSNGTEGSTMTEQDVAAVIYDNQTLKNRSLVEQHEAINHQTALYFLLVKLTEEGDDFQFTSELIKATHLRLMNGIVSDAGLYRNHGVRIRGAAVPLANYLKIPDLIESWCNSANSETADKVELLARTHAEFKRIHPFSDGNGRTGRLMLFTMALKLGLVPPILKKEKRFAYYKYLELAQTKGITDPLEMYIAKAIIETASQIDKIRQTL